MLKLAGRALPGVAHVSVSLPDGQDRQKPRGRKKCRTRDDGDRPAEVDCELELLPEQLPQLKSFVSTLRPRGKNQARQPVKIVHPKCAFWGIDAVTIGKIHDPAPSAGDSVIIRIQMFEWAPEPTEVNAQSKKPKDASDGADGWDIPLRRLPPSQNPDSAGAF
ncbi:MAG: hypothetical protein R3337_00010 [Gammaproteobacteria bacterium]|nr:hypothetical protein [Gammaproteobacteria bacterium]